MLRLHAEPLNSDWYDVLTELLRDLAPLGHFAEADENGGFKVGTKVPLDRSGTGAEQLWDQAHHLRHQTILRAHEAEIRAFERDYPSLFNEMATFQPSAVQPTLQIVDWENDQHVRIVDYLKLYQCVTPGKMVGRRMGLLLWDTGQGSYRLMGAAVLASPRFSQRIRDHRIGWQPDFPKSSQHHDAVARQIRVDGLARMMQLSMACALPPYHWLAGAWLSAMAPFTDVGLEAFRRSLKRPDPGADLAAVVTTSGKSIYGAPFKGHRVVQVAPGSAAVFGARGELYHRAVPGPDFPPLRANFDDLVTPEVQAKITALFAAERPKHFERLNSPDRSAMAYALRRLGLHRSVFDGNDMGVHIGALGADTLDHLRAGTPRPVASQRVLDWRLAVGVWTRKIMPASAVVGESADDASKDQHREARRRRLDAARAFPEDQIRVSSLIGAADPSSRLRIADVEPVVSLG